MTHFQNASEDDFEILTIFNTIYTFTYKKQKRTYSKRHCPICYSYIRKNNVVLNCTHNCCFPCFYQYIYKAYEQREFPICFICRENINELDISNDENKQKIKDIRKFPYIEPTRVTFLYTNYRSYLFNRSIIVIIQTLFFIYILNYMYNLIKYYILSI